MQQKSSLLRKIKIEDEVKVEKVMSELNVDCKIENIKIHFPNIEEIEVSMLSWENFALIDGWFYKKWREKKSTKIIREKKYRVEVWDLEELTVFLEESKTTPSLNIHTHSISKDELLKIIDMAIKQLQLLIIDMKELKYVVYYKKSTIH